MITLHIKWIILGVGALAYVILMIVALVKGSKESGIGAGVGLMLEWFIYTLILCVFIIFWLIIYR